MPDKLPEEGPEIVPDDGAATLDTSGPLPGDNLTLREFISNYMLRLVALFLQASFAAIASGAIIGIVWWKAVLMAGFMGLAAVGKFVFKNMAQTGKIKRRDLDVALALASNDIDSNYNLTSQSTYYGMS